MDDRDELVVCHCARLELGDPDGPHCWIATDSPVDRER